jgi:endonuclease/exonuclease/phosphatase family metal-dependent hydrolase
MRILVYNIAYGTGDPGRGFMRIFNTHRYIRTGEKHFERITDYIQKQKADVVGLVEADTGSFRTRKVDQVQHLANHLDHYHICETKYGMDSPGRRVPILKNHANAILTSQKETSSRFHFLEKGFKKLIIETEIDGVVFFLVHLALRKKTRLRQLEQLAEIIPTDRPVIVAGDFNTYSGEKELEHLKQKTGLLNPNARQTPTFPSWKPKHQLDYILYSQHITPKYFSVPDLKHSDHLPLILEFELKP